MSFFDEILEKHHPGADPYDRSFALELGDPVIDPPEYVPCACDGKQRFRLFIEAGEFGLTCTKCGKTPGWMEEFGDCVTMDEILVTVKDVVVPGKNCGCNLMEQLSHDCGPEFVVSVQKPETDMQCPDGGSHGPHTWVLEGRIGAACPGR